MKQGFTLIELLVVVLIIGILSSIALPQYQKAVDKARGTEAVTAAKTVTDSANLYFLENRKYPGWFDSLTVKAPELKYFDIGTGAGGCDQKVCNLRLISKDGDAVLEYYSDRGKLTGRTCEGNDCTNYFSCIGSGDRCWLDK